MDKRVGNAAILWTGGKDSSLAFYKAKLAGFKIESLVTFIHRDSEFLAHPLKVMKYQAEAMSLPHYMLEIDEPFKKSYENAILYLKEKHGIGTLITGDIAEVDGYPNWIRECNEYSGVDVLTPLWGCDRIHLLNRLLAYNFRVIFSCVKKPHLTIDWLGMELNRSSLERLRVINAETGLDICGEEGEYHTLVVDGPPFKKSIHIDTHSKHAKGDLMYINIEKVTLHGK